MKTPVQFVERLEWTSFPPAACVRTQVTPGMPDTDVRAQHMPGVPAGYERRTQNQCYAARKHCRLRRSLPTAISSMLQPRPTVAGRRTSNAVGPNRSAIAGREYRWIKARISHRFATRWRRPLDPHSGFAVHYPRAGNRMRMLRSGRGESC